MADMMVTFKLGGNFDEKLTRAMFDFQSPTSATRRGGDNRPKAGDFLKPPAFFTAAVPGMDALFDGSYRCRRRSCQRT
jgi:hypothetical protein